MKSRSEKLSKHARRKVAGMLTAKQIRQIREDLHATLEQASLLIQTSFVTWCRWEHGSGIDPLLNAVLVLLDRAVKKSGYEKVTERLKAAAISNNRIEMLQALVELST